MAGRLQDKVALVLGAGTEGGGWGNGKAAAVAFAREGAKVIAADLRLEAARETADIIHAEGGDAIACATDVTNADDLRHAVDLALRSCGRIDVLHHNVGIASIGGVEAVGLQEWERILHTNLTAAFMACRAVIPAMLRQGSGSIVTVSSIGGLGVLKVPVLAYGTSKSGLNFLTRSIAIEHAAQGIRANVLVPGLIDTPMVRNAPGMVRQYTDEDEMIRQRHAWSPTGRMGSVWDIAAAAVFLASDEARYVNGVVLPVDGGLSCRMG